MSNSKRSGVCTFSAISGHILNQGKPVVNAKVIRTTDWKNKKTDEVITDGNGYFDMPAIYESSLASVLPMEFVVAQTIAVVVDGEPVDFWTGVKRKKDENSEGQGEAPVVSCELSNEAAVITVDGQPFITKCKWNVVPDKLISIEDMLKTDDD